MTSNTNDSLDFDSFRIYSRREIISLLRNISTRNQLVRMHVRGNPDIAAVTAILEVDDTGDAVIIDTASSQTVTQRLLAHHDIAFETVLDSIRILFSASHLEQCTHEGNPALLFPIPESVIRLQRREYYRVKAPVANPIRCMITPPVEEGETPVTLILPLYNVSAGGIAVVDEKKQLTAEYGQVFENCQIDLPGGPVTLSLCYRGAQEITLNNGKNIRRLGFEFEKPSNAVQAAIQRYITKLEREQNARATGLG